MTRVEQLAAFVARACYKDLSLEAHTRRGRVVTYKGTFEEAEERRERTS